MKTFFVWLVLYYLRFFAKISLFLWRPKVVGITGSVGKSSCRNAVFSVLKSKFGSKVKVIEKGNSETGIPLGILGLKIADYSFLGWLKVLLKVPFGVFYLKNTKYLVIEMGIDDPYPPKNMSYLLTIVKPDIAVFLNVHPVHSEQFGKVGKTREEILQKIAEEKGKIIVKSGCKVAIYNSENKYVKEVIEKNKSRIKAKVYSFGKSSDNYVKFVKYDFSAKGSKFEFEIERKRLVLNFSKFILPEVYFETLSPAIIIGRIVGLTLRQIKGALENDFSLPYSRSSLFQGIKNSLIIDSTYNASYSSTSSLLDLAYKLAKKEKKELVFLFGDMRELGSLARQEHEKIAKEILGKAQYVYLVGNLTRKYVLPIVKKSGKVKEVLHFKNSLEAGKYLAKNLPSNSIVLAKGSQNTIFLEEAVKFLLKNREDEKKLCRQDKYWLKRKEKFFKARK